MRFPEAGKGGGVLRGRLCEAGEKPAGETMKAAKNTKSIFPCFLLLAPFVVQEK
jgi:hypothetical protein